MDYFFSSFKELKELLAPIVKEKNGTIEKNHKFIFTIKIPFIFQYNNFKNEKENFNSILIMDFKYDMDIDSYYYELKIRLPNGEDILLKEILKTINISEKNRIINYLFNREKKSLSPMTEKTLTEYDYKKEKTNKLPDDFSEEEIRQTVELLYKKGCYSDIVESVFYSNKENFLISLEETIGNIYETTENFLNDELNSFIYSKDLFEGVIIFNSLETFLTKSNGFYLKQYFNNLGNKLKSEESFIRLINEYFKINNSVNKIEEEMKEAVFQRYFFKIFNEESFISINKKTNIRPFFNKELIKNIITYGKDSLISKEGKAERIITAALSYFINKEGISFLNEKEWEKYNKTEYFFNLFKNNKSNDLFFIQNEFESRIEKITKILQFFNLFPDMNFLTKEKKILLLKEFKQFIPYIKINKQNEYESFIINYRTFLYKNPEIVLNASKNKLIDKETFNNKEFLKELRKLLEQKISGEKFKKIFAHFSEIKEKDLKNSIFSYKFPETYEELEMFGKFNMIQKYLKIKDQKEKIKNFSLKKINRKIDRIQ